jgi:hypothetical protein
MARTSVNPGRWLELVAALELVGEDEQLVLDVESKLILELSTLLQAFREDPSEPRLGWIKITIEPGP